MQHQSTFPQQFVKITSNKNIESKGITETNEDEIIFAFGIESIKRSGRPADDNIVMEMIDESDEIVLLELG